MGGTTSRATAALPPDPAPVRSVLVSPTGDDAAAGTASAPLRTLHQAQQAARKLRSVQPGPVSITLAPGRYELARPLEFDDAADGNTVWSGAAAAGQVRISGGALVGPWEREGVAGHVGGHARRVGEAESLHARPRLHEEWIAGAVVAAVELEDVVAAGEAPGQPDGIAQVGLGLGVAPGGQVDLRQDQVHLLGFCVGNLRLPIDVLGIEEVQPGQGLHLLKLPGRFLTLFAFI